MQNERTPPAADEKTGRSSLLRLPPEILEDVDAAIGDGATIDETVALIRARGGECSRSAVGRYAKSLRDAMQWRHELDRCAETWLRVLGERAEGNPALMALEALRVLTLKTMGDLAKGREQVPAADIVRLALALRQIEGADKSRGERERATAEAEARATGGPPYSQGLSDEAVAIIRRAVECEFSR